MKKYSIILPVFNGGVHFKECVNSILAQTLQDFNLLILDNCSTDGTREWVAQLNDDRIQIFVAPAPLSMTENWGRIRSLEKNEFMTIIGHDDLLHPNYLSTMYSLIGKFPNAGLYQAHFKFIDAEGKDIKPCLKMPEDQSAAEFLKAQFTWSRDSMGTGYMMRSKDYDSLGGIPPYPRLIFADYELWVRLSLKNGLITSPVECFSYRLHNSTSRLTNGEDYQQAFGKYVEFLTGLTKTNNSIAEVVRVHGKKFLLYFCESLSHRLLKTSPAERTTSVKQYIDLCRKWAGELIPGQEFQPLLYPKILAAQLLDNALGLKLFKLYKGFSS